MGECYMAYADHFYGFSVLTMYKGHFTHEPRAVTMKLRKPKRKCPKAAQHNLQNHVVRSWILKCNVKSWVTRPSTKCYFNDFLFNRMNQWLWGFGVPWSPGFVSGLPPRGSFWNNPSDHETWSIRCHVGIHVDFTSILHSLTPLVPQM